MRGELEDRCSLPERCRAEICYSEYLGNGSRLGYVPLIEPPGNGVTQAQVTGLLRMFLSGSVTGIARFRSSSSPSRPLVRSETWRRAKIRYH